MTDTLPDKKKYTCLVTAQITGLEPVVHLQKVRTNGRLLAHSLTLDLSSEPLSKPASKAVLKYLGGTQIIHFKDAESIATLNAQIQKQGFTSMDNSIFDAAPLVSALCRTPGLPQHPNLDDLAQLHGTPQSVRDAAHSCPVAKASLLHQVWCLTIQPALTYARDLSEHLVAEPREMTPIDISLHGLPLPAPVIPVLEMPACGWRRSKWDMEEARDCALRFVDGADIQALCALFRRSPKAIYARLCLDGILKPQ